MRIPATLYGDYRSVATGCRRAIRRCQRGESNPWEALADDGLIDLADHRDPVVLSGPDVLCKATPSFRCGLPVYLLLTDRRLHLSPDQEEAVFTTGLTQSWSLLCLLDQQAMYGWFTTSDRRVNYARCHEYVQAVLHQWETLDAAGARYALDASDRPERLGRVVLRGGCALLWVLANLGVPSEILRAPLPEAGGLYALLAQAEPARAGDLVALGQAQAASWRARSGETRSTETTPAPDTTLPDDVVVSAAMSAAMHADDPVTVRRLIAAGEPWDRTDMDLLHSPLLWAAEQGYRDLVEVLLERGASTEDRADEGESPLMLAAYHGHADTVRLLLERGADPTYRSDKGWDAVAFAELGKQAKIAAVLEQAQREYPGLSDDDELNDDEL